MGDLFCNPASGGKENAFLKIYPHLRNLETWLRDVLDDINAAIAEYDERQTLIDFTNLKRCLHACGQQIECLNWYIDGLEETERTTRFGHLATLKTAIEKCYDSCYRKDITALRESQDDLDYWPEYFGIDAEFYAEAAFGPWGGYLFFFGANECAEELAREDFTTAGLSDLIRAANAMWDESPDVPTPLQERIMMALDGRALKKEPLAAVVCKGQGRTLYKPGGIRELMDSGRVAHKHGVGYFRPDALPGRAVPQPPNISGP